MFIFKSNYSRCINAHCALDLLFYKIKVFTDTTAISVITNVTEPVSSFEKIAKLKRSNQYIIVIFLRCCFSFPLKFNFTSITTIFSCPSEKQVYTTIQVLIYFYFILNDNVTKCVFLKK